MNIEIEQIEIGLDEIHIIASHSVAVVEVHQLTWASSQDGALASHSCLVALPSSLAAIPGEAPFLRDTQLLSSVHWHSVHAVDDEAHY